MSLKLRFIMLTFFLFLSSTLVSWWGISEVSGVIIDGWAKRYSQAQVLYDKARILEPILREVALSKQLANTSYIVQWAKNSDDPELRKQAFIELEKYRLNFQDNSYFVVLENNLNYYHNNAKNEFLGNEYRYTLDPNKKSDSWYFDLIKQNRDLHININRDIPLGITKLWIDIIIRDGDKILGMTGTGLDLTRFLNDVVDTKIKGISSLFIDYNGAIQLYRDQGLIDFSSISKTDDERKNIDLLIKDPDENQKIRAIMKDLKNGKESFITEFVHMANKRYLAGLVYLPEIDWYEITLIDLKSLLPVSSFFVIILIYILILLLALISYTLVLNRLVLKPLAVLNAAMGQVEQGEDPTSQLKCQGSGEIKNLIEHFKSMSKKILQNKNELERIVRQRTEKLEILIKIDPLTGLLNRRGFITQLSREFQRMRREGKHIGLVWIDIDWFKEINDNYGHATGDKILKTVAEIIEKNMRPYDLSARWGGDEFLIAIYPTNLEILEKVIQRILKSFNDNLDVVDKSGKPLQISASIGGYITDQDDDLDSAIHKADRALYQAKENGKNCYHIKEIGDPPTSPRG